MKDQPFELWAGLGNKINHLLNGITSGVRDFNWVVDRFGEARWEDLFANKPRGIRVINTQRCDQRYYDWFFRFPDKMEAAADFLRELVPSSLVKEHIIQLPEKCIGHSARLKHGHRARHFPPFSIAETGFLSSDCCDMRRLNPHLIQSDAKGGVNDLDPVLRGFHGTITSTADWFTLMQCSKIVNYGIVRPGLQRPHSTFLDAHEILGMTIEEGVSV